jgi:hypothetical protein
MEKRGLHRISDTPYSEALGQDHFPSFRQSHDENKQERYGVQRQHNRPVPTIRAGIAARKEELAHKEVSQHQDERRDQAHGFADMIHRCFTDDHKHEEGEKSWEKGSQSISPFHCSFSESD